MFNAFIQRFDVTSIIENFLKTKQSLKSDGKLREPVWYSVLGHVVGMQAGVEECSGPWPCHSAL